MRIVSIIFLLLLSKQICCQTLEEDNWRAQQTHIVIDTNKILKNKITIDNVEFNYRKVYTDGAIIEYGNVNKKQNAQGTWTYYKKSDILFLSGNTENGFKVGQWTITNCLADGSYLKYRWKKDKTRTYIYKSKNALKKLRKQGQMAK